MGICVCICIGFCVPCTCLSVHICWFIFGESYVWWCCRVHSWSIRVPRRVWVCPACASLWVPMLTPCPLLCPSPVTIRGPLSATQALQAAGHSWNRVSAGISVPSACPNSEFTCSERPLWPVPRPWPQSSLHWTFNFSSAPGSLPHPHHCTGCSLCLELCVWCWSVLQV